MSRAALEAMSNALVTAGTFGLGDKTPGKTFRGFSQYAKHRVNVSKSELNHELADLIYNSLGYDSTFGTYNYKEQVALDPNMEQYVFTNNELLTLTNIVYSNLFTAFEELRERYKNSDSVITIRGTKDGDYFEVDVFAKDRNNYDIIGRAFSKAWEGKGQYGGLKDFIINSLSPKSEMVMGIVQSAEGTKSGIDVLHGKSSDLDISNIQHFINVIGINAIRNAYNIDLSKLSDEELELVERDMKETFSNTVALDQLWATLYRAKVINTTKETFHKVLDSYVETTAVLLRKVTKGGSGLQFKVETKIQNVEQLKKEAIDLLLEVRPGSAYGNQWAGAQFESQLGALVAERNKATFLHISKWLSGAKSGLGKGLQYPPLPDMTEGSPTLRNMTELAILEALETGKISPKTNTTTSSARKTPEKVKIPKLFTIKDPGSLTSKQNISATKITKTVARKRSSQLNIINIVNMINMDLADKIRENMGTPKLNWRTGRFAKSAQVLSGSMDKDGYLRLPYTYMKYPYQTFEPGFARGDKERDPRKVISESIRELAIKLVLMKMRVVRV